MIALDTSVLARYILIDNPLEHRIAEETISANNCTVSWSVLVELCWVLESRARLTRREVADGLAIVAGTDHIAVPDAAFLSWAIDRYMKGADFADMVHLASAMSGATEFACFDRKLSKQAGPDTPIVVRTLRA